MEVYSLGFTGMDPLVAPVQSPPNILVSIFFSISPFPTLNTKPLTLNTITTVTVKMTVISTVVAVVIITVIYLPFSFPFRPSLRATSKSSACQLPSGLYCPHFVPAARGGQRV